MYDALSELVAEDADRFAVPSDCRTPWVTNWVRSTAFLMGSRP